MNKMLGIGITIAFIITLVGCSNSDNSDKNFSGDKKYSVALMTDTGGISDQAFNQSAYEGLLKVKEDFDFDIKYIESKQVADYKTNLDTLTDANPNMIFVMGYTAADDLKDVAKINFDQKYTIIDYQYDDEILNVNCITFKDEESAFLAGYIAANMTKTDKLGFIGGGHSMIIDRYEYGYKSGILYAAKELGKDIKIDAQYAESFQDDTKGKAMANIMYSNGIDVIFHAAGNLGKGVIESAKDNDKYVIGADRDQSYLAPNNVISSTIKYTGEVVYQIAKEVKEGKDISGKNRVFGLKENGVGISESTEKIVGTEIMLRVNDIKNKVINNQINPPYDEKTYENFLNKYNL